jgi:uncharacterized membrane protein YphA (DoxX/SURF4 family)
MASASSRSTGWILLLFGRLALGGLLIYAAYAKLRAPWAQFAVTVDGYKLLPPDAIIPIAKFLPWFELALGILVVIGIGLRWFAALATLLLATFFAVLVRSLAKGMQIDCGCFGPGGDPLSWKTLVRDGIFLAGSLAVTLGAFWRHRANRRAGAIAQDAGLKSAATQPQT